MATVLARSLALELALARTAIAGLTPKGGATMGLYFPLSDTGNGVLGPSEHTTRYQDLGATSWYTVRADQHSKPRALLTLRLAL